MWCEKALDSKQQKWLHILLVNPFKLKNVFLYKAKKSEKDVCRLFRLLSSDDEDDMDDAKKYLSQRLYLTLKKPYKKIISHFFLPFFN